MNKVRIIQPKEYLEKERDRLIKCKEEDPDWWTEEFRADWARDLFGPTLTEKDGSQHFINTCCLCEEHMDPESNILEIDFDYDCYECGSGIQHICNNCSKDIKKLLERL